MAITRRATPKEIQTWMSESTSWRSDYPKVTLQELRALKQDEKGYDMIATLVGQEIT